MTNRVRTIFIALLTAAALSGTAGAQTPAAPAALIQSADLAPLGIGLEGINYPYPVHYLDLTLEGQPVRMAYMDVPPAAAANGKTVVLLHGKSFSGDYWGHTIATLTGQGYRVIAPDQIGFGKSSKPDIRYHFDILARNTKTLLDSLGVTRAAIVGHSFGGMLAVYFARNYPETTQVRAGAGEPDRSRRLSQRHSAATDRNTDQDRDVADAAELPRLHGSVLRRLAAGRTALHRDLLAGAAKP